MQRHWLRILGHIGALVPLAWIAWDYFLDNLTINPIQDITLRTGKAALILLVLSLACTPFNRITGVRRVMVLRRPLGLYAFLYALLHLLTFVGLDYGFRFDLMARDLANKPYIFAGLASFLLLLLLATTSTRGWMRRLGKNWKRLHRLAYPAAVLAVLHYVWLVKADIREPLVYGAIVGALLIARLPWQRWKQEK